MLKRILTIVFILLLFPLSAAGLYGFVWWKVSTAADELALQMSPFAQMKYAQVHIDLLEKEVGLKEITFSPQGSSGDIALDSLILRAPSWGFLLDLQSKLNKGDMPDSFSLDLQGLNVNLNSAYMNDWAAMAVGMQEQAPQGYDTLGCGNLRFFGLPEMRKMGYGNLRSNLSLSYKFDAMDQELNFDVVSDISGMMKADASMKIQIATDSLNVQTAMFSQPKLQRLELRYKDGGYNNRRNKLCAELNGHSVEQYREKYAALLEQRLKYEGWIIPEALFATIDSLNDSRASVYARIDIPQGFGPQSMVMVQGPSDLLNMLSPYMEVAGKPVSLDGLDWEQPDKEMQRAALAKLQQLEAGDAAETETEASGAKLDTNKSASVPVEVVTEQSSSVEKPIVNKPVVFQRTQAKSFKEVKLSVLPKNIGEQVILYTYFGRKIEGKLLSVTQGEVTVLHRLVDGRGTATYPIARNKIETVKLFH